MRRDDDRPTLPGGEGDDEDACPEPAAAGGERGGEGAAADGEALAEELLDGADDLGEGAEDAEGEDGSKKAAKKAEEDPPGPDVPAPSVKVLRKAMTWAFEGEVIEESVLDAFAEHAHRLLDHNRKVNLTAILDPKEVAAKHYLDSWRLTQYLSFLGRRILDLGSGGGFPGLPLALAEPNASVCLVESSSKKAAFLAECVEAMGIKNCSVHDGRCEDLLLTERCDMVLVRAVSSVRENVRTLRKVRHSLKEYVMLKGASWSREVRAGEREAERLGFRLNTVFEHELPGEMGKRGILVYRAPGGQGL
ncbi:MAG: 16S rRNA (guanine(527)-N(7))-methyltransferase RsmG [Planctomycetota bacterium]|jgi:16S rRNA (guanine527-N7)-methyltransferase|nr:16S rRNA (guanine(527)-N(7))-methyltransferase RsmG [Planctomycetota bacterium]MDP6990032.1 16S rRNA (guanine(527)-N(7))-methyltransferase RsmG [Planctomycetota bacterium]